MMKLLLFFYAIAAVFKFFAKIFSSLFRRVSARNSEPIQTTLDWCGICEKCGTKGGLHTFEGKRYCAMCNARLSAEKKYGKKQEHQ